ncbi:hypothetical protein LINPERPRIM_LOCUS20934 [Linum perenne]
MLCSLIPSSPASNPSTRIAPPRISTRTDPLSPTLSLYVSTVVVSNLDCRVGTPVAHPPNFSLLHDSHLQSPADWKNPSKGV